MDPQPLFLRRQGSLRQGQTFFDNAGGSLRLKAAEEEFHRIDSIPDASEHSNAVAKELAKIEEEGREAIHRILFNAKSGTIYPSYTASQIAMEMIRVILENAKGTNVVITQLEHPSVYDAAAMYGSMHGMELRIADHERGLLEMMLDGTGDMPGMREMPGVIVRMVEAFGSKGMVRLSPLHVNTPEEISRFLQITQEIAAL